MISIELKETWPNYHLWIFNLVYQSLENETLGQGSGVTRELNSLSLRKWGEEF
jgi:hypothetical protein